MSRPRPRRLRERANEEDNSCCSPPRSLDVAQINARSHREACRILGKIKIGKRRVREEARERATSSPVVRSLASKFLLLPLAQTGHAPRKWAERESFRAQTTIRSSTGRAPPSPSHVGCKQVSPVARHLCALLTGGQSPSSATSEGCDYCIQMAGRRQCESQAPLAS